MNQKINRSTINYNIGLDIGTNSIGWVVTDLYGNLLKFKNRSMAGVVLVHQKGETALKRRNFRSSRRHIVRRKQRIKLVQQLMSNMILPEDPNFFERMNYSYISKDDNFVNTPDYAILFDNQLYTSLKNIYKTFPTIFHLRKELVTTNHKMDIRLIYLAIHHIVKYRGNFLYEDEELSIKNLDLEESIKNLVQALFPGEDDIDFVEETSQNINSILLSKILSKSEKKDELIKVFKGFKKLEINNIAKWANALACLILGYVGDISILFDTENELKICLLDDIDDKINQLSDDNLIILDAIKKVCSGFTLSNIITIGVVDNKNLSISDTYISTYNKHQKDLKTLKAIFHDLRNEKYKSSYIECYRSSYSVDHPNWDYDTITKLLEKKFKLEFTDYFVTKYKELFYLKSVKKEQKNTKTKEEPLDNYVNYISNNFNKKVTNEKLCNELKKSLEDIQNRLASIGIDDNRITYCLESISNNDFLLKPRNINNGAIPNQFHVEELEKIINNQGKYYPELLEIKEKLISIAKFRIPYSVGPLSEAHGDYLKNHWIIKKDSSAKIYPWNFEEVVDVDNSSLEFVRRLTNYCTYLDGEKVLPKSSLLFSEYSIFNELSNITINGFPLAPDCKQAVFNDLFKKYKTVKIKKFIDWYNINYNKTNEECILKGLSDKDAFLSSYGSYIDLTRIIGPIDNDGKKQLAEDIIEYVTIFNDKKILGRMIKKKFPNLSNEQILQIKKLKYSGWGSLSRKLLTGIYVLNETGMPLNIMDYLHSTTGDNFMRILHEYKFIKEINIINKKIAESVNEDVNEIISKASIPPAVKKNVLISYKVVKEIEHVMGHTPKAIYTETTREEAEKKQSTQRYKQLLSKYENALKNGDELYNHLINELKEYKSKTKQKELTKDALYLYFLQNGKCLYSGEPLDINKIYDYEIDHIIPRCLIKDDSLNNKALVKRAENQRKSDKLSLRVDVIEKQKAWWQSLVKAELMSMSKFNNLCRLEYTEDDLRRFENRQIVETSQIVKNVNQVLKRTFPNTNVYGVSARLTSNIKNHINLPKIRELNDFHHIHDAYVTVLAGDFITKRLNSSNSSVFMDIYRKIKEMPNFKEKLKYGIFCSLRHLTVANAFYNGRLAEHNSRSFLLFDHNLSGFDFDCVVLCSSLHNGV